MSLMVDQCAWPHSRTGTPAAFVIHSASSSASVPFSRSASTAALTSSTIGDSRSSTSPNWSGLSPAGSWPMILPPSISSAETYSAVGRSNTTTSTSPEASACLAWSLSLNSETALSGSTAASTTAALVVPTIAPILSGLRPAMSLTPAAGESSVVTTAWVASEYEEETAMVALRSSVVATWLLAQPGFVPPGGEAELGRDRVGDRGLVAPPARGVVVDDPRLVGGVGGADRELALGDRLERRRGVGRGGLGAARGRLGVGGRARGERKDARGGQGGQAGGRTHRGLLGATRRDRGRGAATAR